MDVQARFETLVDTLAAEPGVQLPGSAGHRGFGSRALRLHGSAFAMVVSGRVVLKLPAERVRGPVELGAALIETAIEGCQAEHVTTPCNVARTVAVDTADVGATDFNITPAQRDRLIARGHTAAAAFLAGWDYDAWLARCAPVPATGRGQSSGRSSSA